MIEIFVKGIKIKYKLNKRGGVFFSLDAILASIILLMTSLVILSFFLSGPVSSDARAQLDVLSSYIFINKIENINPTIYNIGSERDLGDLYVHEMIALLVQRNEEEKVQNFIENIDNFLLLESYGILYELEDNTVYYRPREPLNKATTNISTSFLTYFIYDDSAYGPLETKVTIWT